jgi:hypothetical protein
MRGKWAQGIVPRHFAWILKDRLAVSERPGGQSATHRRVRRQEELVWLKVQGFTRVVSLLPSPHNLAAYDEAGMPWSHHPVPATGEAGAVLEDLYAELDARLEAGERILVHYEELGDRLAGVVAGYLVWSGRVPGPTEAILAVEQLVGRRMGPAGRELVAEAVTLNSGSARERSPS